MQESKVALKICKQYNIEIISNCLKEGFDLLGGLNKFIKPNMKVLIKPDLYEATNPNEAKTTNPYVVSALADLIAREGASCIIADSPKGNFNQSRLDSVYIKTKMLEVSNDGNAMLNVNDDITTIHNPKGVCCRDIYIMDAVNQADIIINVGKFRCDKYLGLIGCSQNLFGLVPGNVKKLIKSRCYKLKSYYNYIIDLNEALENKVVLNILDGIVSCEANNDPRILNAILIGENCYSVDEVALKIINQPANLLLTESQTRQKVDFGAEIVGDNLQSLVCADYNYSSLYENVERGSSKHFKRKYNKLQKRPIISSTLCKGCRICENNCPMKAIKMKNGTMGQYADIDYNQCINCFKCVDNCPYKVVTTKTPFAYKRIENTLNRKLK